MEELICECGNKDQDRFYAVTPVTGYTMVGYTPPLREQRPVRKLEGWRCQDCQKVHKTL